MKKLDSHSCPYTGLRPFEARDLDYFFGRKKQSHEIIELLNSSGFVVVLGYSGSGKSSLVKCGAIPLLKRERLRRWEILEMRPGNSPMMNLTRSFVESEGLFEPNEVSEEWILSVLRRSSNGLVDLIGYSKRTERTPLLLVVDQFEELFRFRKYEEREKSAESLHFVNLLIKASQKSNSPLYVVLTMRSEFLGDCSVFSGLPETINAGQYLIPAMTRNELKEVITGPVRVFNHTHNRDIKLSKGFVETLLNDVPSDQDLLPILQHALFRTWKLWEEKGDTDMLRQRDYISAGTMAAALDKHAAEIYDSLGSEDSITCANVFKAITERDSDGIETRRPVRISLLARITGVSEKGILNIIAAFDKSGAFFSMYDVADSVHQQRETIVDICHESLMRRWTKLKQWVHDEAADAMYYFQLSTKASAYQSGKGELLRRRDLKEAEAWFRKRKPNEYWATRYDQVNRLGVGFEEVDQYVKRSKKQRTLTRGIVAITGTTAFLFAMISLVYWITSQREIREQKEHLEIANIRMQGDSVMIAQQLDELSGNYRIISDQLSRIKRDSSTIADHVVKLTEDSLVIRRQYTALEVQKNRIGKQLDQIKKDSAFISGQRTHLARLNIILEATNKTLDSINIFITSENNALLALNALELNQINIADSLARLAYNSLKKGQPDGLFYKALEATWLARISDTDQYLQIPASTVGISQMTIGSELLFTSDIHGNLQAIQLEALATGVSFEILGESRISDGTDQIIDIQMDFTTGDTYVLTKKGKLYLVKTYVNRDEIRYRLDQVYLRTEDGEETTIMAVDPGNDLLYSKNGTSLLSEKLGRPGEKQLVYTAESTDLDLWILDDWLAIRDVDDLVLKQIENVKSTFFLSGINHPTIVKNINNHSLLVGDQSGNVWYYDLAILEVRPRLVHKRESAITDIAIRRERQSLMVAIASLDNRVAVLRVDEGFTNINENDTWVLQHDSWVLSVDFWQDHPYIVTSGEGATVRFWPVSLEQSASVLSLLDQLKQVTP